MITRIYLIRHGECRGNREGLFRGRYDFPLNETGKRQAASLARELADIELEAVYTSPLMRAYETALTLCKDRNIEPVITEVFNNIDLGSWEGRPKKGIAESFPREFRLWRTEPEKLKMKGAETLAQVQNRAVKALAARTHEHPGASFALVTHRAVIKPLIAGLLGIPEPYFWKLHPETASYSIIEYTNERGYALALFNQTKHIKEFIREDM
ncbi:histidine phosphatase family protein [candidate division WOR-3 bacterium]|uniref:Histidine phosphatase family protein n=1 Tax=candidate division WOR-3 bacterium TaxID=2052148 RepID=A0A9D5KA34_UNCW3|nr:histidine phosphatase family protein [candidate division WOR-3 bacterium]MBD3365242.1 histidine phosphatase family protein [candidate division WOR-3 bacterium]